MKIAVAGGTGQVGRHVVEAAHNRGHETVVLTRSTGVDLMSGDGVVEALTGANVVIDVAATTTMSKSKASEFFETATRSLYAAEQAVGIGHHIALSIVAIDAIDVGYYGAKLAHERAVQAGTVPWTIQRATQFHEFAGQVFQRGSFGPLHLAMRMRTQPVAAREVAERLIDLAEAGPSGRATDLAGPQEESLVEMIRAFAGHQGVRAWIPAFSLPGAWGRALRNGLILPGPEADLGKQSFAEWLSTQ